MDKDSKIYVAGHKGLVGSAIWQQLTEQGYRNLVGRTHRELDLLNQEEVLDFLNREKPEYVFLAAAKVGGIWANKEYPAEFIYQNLQIQNNVIHGSYLAGVKKLLFLGSTCIYPKMSPQPIREEYLLSDYLESSNEPYAIAKIAGIKMCQSYNRQYGTNFIAGMPTNLYGPGDNFDLEKSHVLPAMMRKFHEAKKRGDKEVTLWGSGTPLREFLYVLDLAEACVFLMDNFNPNERQNERGEIFVNIGTGQEIKIADLAAMIQKIVGFEGEIVWDQSKPDGTPRKLTEISKINIMGWQAKTSLEDGISETYEWFLTEQHE